MKIMHFELINFSELNKFINGYSKNTQNNVLNFYSMYLKKIKTSKLKIRNKKQLLFSSVITLGILCPSNLISQH